MRIAREARQKLGWRPERIHRIQTSDISAKSGVETLVGLASAGSTLGCQPRSTDAIGWSLFYHRQSLT